MASGVPVVASDLEVHQEICGEAAACFSRFSAESLAGAVARVAQSPDTLRRMAAAGAERVQTFSWKTHVEKILELCRGLIAAKKGNET
jgi:glycosyltransferase involved in cell wall biosynthesis